MTSQFFQAVLFDMDGLTIDSEPQWLEVERELTARFDYQWTLEDQAFCLGGPLSRVGQYMSEMVNGAETGEYFHQGLISEMAKKVRARAVFMPGAQSLIDSLHKSEIPMALVSASPRVIVDAALAHIQPLPFKTTISSDDVSKTKPDPEGYLKAAQILGVDIKQTLILEDSVTGVKAARASGAKVIAVPHLVKIETDIQTKVIRTLEELDIDVLRKFYLNW